MSNMNLNNENQAELKEPDNRWYTLTIKPCFTSYKGNGKQLFDKFLSVIHDMNYIHFEHRIECQGTNNEHIHALVQVKRYIPNKMVISKSNKYYGYHIKFDIIRKEYETDQCSIFRHYMHKEISDSEKFYIQYGNGFLPINDQESIMESRTSSKTYIENK